MECFHAAANKNGYKLADLLKSAGLKGNTGDIEMGPELNLVDAAADRASASTDGQMASADVQLQADDDTKCDLLSDSEMEDKVVSHRVLPTLHICTLLLIIRVVLYFHTPNA